MEPTARDKVHEALSDALDAALLAAITRTDPPPTAAEMTAAMNRLKNLGITKIVLPESDAGKLAGEMGLTVEDLKLPDLQLLREDVA